MNTESILNQFESVDKSLHRAKLPFDTGMLQKPNVEVVLYELIKAHRQIENMIREIDPIRFGVKETTEIKTHIPKLDESRLFICTICGQVDCGSDHK